MPRYQKPSPRNVLVMNHTIPVKVLRFFTDVDGRIVAKGAVPAALQTRYPVFLLGDFDRQGGYRIASQICPPDATIVYLQTFVHRYNGIPTNIIGFSGFDEITNQLKTGDIVSVYTDSLSAPTYFVWIVVQNDYAAMGSIIGNSESVQNDRRIGQLFIDEINYFVTDETQYNEVLHYTVFDNIGTYRDNQIQPLLFKTPYVEQQNFITIETDFKLDQYLGINLYMLFANDSLTFNFKLSKIG